MHEAVHTNLSLQKKHCERRYIYPILIEGYLKKIYLKKYIDRPVLSYRLYIYL
jgi:hypothetical protein